VNAHPHYSENGSIALIHNGIIENYGVLKAMLAEKGYTFRSETDTEVLVQFIEYLHTENRCTLFEAVQAALNQVIGAYAIAVLDRTNNDEIIAARKSSPLVVGIGEGEYFLASDATPIVEYVKDVVYLNDGEIAVINRHKPLKVVNLNNIESKIDIRKLEMNISELEKGGYPHFMLKEIFEQPRTITDCIRGRINVEGTNVVLSGILDNKERFLNARRIIFVACGTSWHAGLIGEYLFEDLCGIEVKVEYASEFRYRNPVIHSDDVVIAISQSGETADTLAAIELAKSKGAFVYGICNVVGSSIARATHSGTYIHVGPEIGVASTKAFTGQVTVLVMMAMMLAKMKGLIDEEKYREVLRGLIAMPNNIKEVLDQHEHIQSVASIFTYARNFLYLGRGCNYPTAMEGALKLKEISYIHAEGCPAAEMKHGTIALIDQEMPTIVIATNGSVYEKTISNIQEIKARGGKVIVVVTEGDCIVAEMADYCIWIPKTAECLTPLLSSIPLQLFAYYIAVNKGRNVDQPRNLAKSVTVE
jgi:glucosamine--fructose-6-phosphate aminotransferase (isomerizing)